MFGLVEEGVLGRSIGLMSTQWVWWHSTTSVLSARYGLTDFLRVGPLKTIPNQPASGFGHLSFWLAFLTNLSSLCAKGFFMLEVRGPYSLDPGIFVTFLPQLLLAVLSLLSTKVSSYGTHSSWLPNFQLWPLCLCSPYSPLDQTHSVADVVVNGQENETSLWLHFYFISINTADTGSIMLMELWLIHPLST